MKSLCTFTILCNKYYKIQNDYDEDDQLRRHYIAFRQIQITFLEI